MRRTEKETMNLSFYPKKQSRRILLGWNRFGLLCFVIQGALLFILTLCQENVENRMDYNCKVSVRLDLKGSQNCVGVIQSLVVKTISSEFHDQSGHNCDSQLNWTWVRVWRQAMCTFTKQTFLHLRLSFLISRLDVKALFLLLQKLNYTHVR